MNRRRFLEQTAAAAAAGLALPAVLPAARLAWAGPIGLQLYTVRDDYARDPLGTLKKLYAIGYREVELLFIPSVTTLQLKQNLHESGLAAHSGHYVPGPNHFLPDQTDKLHHAIADWHTLGLHYMVCMMAFGKTEDDWKKIADILNHAGHACAAAGLQFAYHNHMEEFRPVAADDGKTTNGYQIMLHHCDPKLVKMELDIFWATYARQDTLALFRQNPGRFPLLHVKDIKKNLESMDRAEFPPASSMPFVEVGQGAIDWKAIFAHTAQAGVRHVYVEQDRCDVPPLQAAQASFEYLKHLTLG